MICGHASPSLPQGIPSCGSTDLSVPGTLGSQAVDVHKPSHWLISHHHRIYFQLLPATPETPHPNFDLETDPD